MTMRWAAACSGAVSRAASSHIRIPHSASTSAFPIHMRMRIHSGAILLNHYSRAGKTTLPRIICGQLAAEGGAVTRLGRLVIARSGWRSTRC